MVRGQRRFNCPRLIRRARIGAEMLTPTECTRVRDRGKWDFKTMSNLNDYPPYEMFVCLSIHHVILRDTCADSKWVWKIGVWIPLIAPSRTRLCLEHTQVVSFMFLKPRRWREGFSSEALKLTVGQDLFPCKAHLWAFLSPYGSIHNPCAFSLFRWNFRVISLVIPYISLAL